MACLFVIVIVVFFLFCFVLFVFFTITFSHGVVCKIINKDLIYVKIAFNKLKVIYYYSILCNND